MYLELLTFWRQYFRYCRKYLDLESVTQPLFFSKGLADCGLKLCLVPVFKKD